MTAVRRRCLDTGCLDTGVTTAQEKIAVFDLQLRPTRSAARLLVRPADPAATAPPAA